MTVSRHPCCGFAPDALSKLAAMADDVWKELARESLGMGLTRTELAKKVFALARYSWTEAQLRELLLRAFRNEALRLRRTGSASHSSGVIARPAIDSTGLSTR